MDFLELNVQSKTSNNRSEDFKIRPDFKIGGITDLVCKGGGFYAFWYEGMWRQSKDELVAAVDKELYLKHQKISEEYPHAVITSDRMSRHSTRVMKEFEDYTKVSPQSEVEFNKRIIFENETIKKEDYATTQLDYSPEKGDTPAFDEMFSLLYEQMELDKILWFIGALLTNNMTKIQKFLYLYGGKGTGKGTALMLFKELFQGYYEPINLQQLTSDSAFASGQIKEVPLLIDEDSNMSRIRDDTTLLKMTAHEPVTVNRKYQSEYDITFQGLLVTASNQRFKVRNIDSGITRRAVVAEPTGMTHGSEDYHRLASQMMYELPQIAWKAMETFERLGLYYFEDYMPVSMAEATDHIYSFVREHYVTLGDPVTLKRASELYKLYLEDIGFETTGYKRIIKLELQRYYDTFEDSKMIDGERFRNLYSGFKHSMVFPDELQPPELNYNDESAIMNKMGFGRGESTFDIVAADYPAQPTVEVNGNMIPEKKWDDVVTTLSDIPTDKLHYVRIPLNHIVIDFDKKNIKGEKDLAYNLEAASKFPPTYAELSKSGQGVHLHYIYDGDVTKLESLYEEDVEIKIFTGKSSLRRKLTWNNGKDISHITSGLPKKKEEGVKVYEDVKIIAWNEKKIRTAVKGNLEKKYHDNTKPSMDFIAHIIKEAEESGVKYDLRDMRQDILAFAASSTNQSSTCIRIANGINYTTIDNEKDAQVFQEDLVIVDLDDIWFYDVEVYPNLFIVAYKQHGAKDTEVMINPTPNDIENLLEKALVGFNNRRYDNHILYARLLGEDNAKLYQQSQRIINGQGGSGMYGGAYEMSYADIYEYSSKKQSLAKWQVELGIHHDEMELPWDQPVPEHLWDRVAEYCINDVVSTEAVFEETFHDYNARMILTSLSGLKVNATTTQHAAAFLFGDEWTPQNKFIYKDLSEDFPGYKYEFGKSTYRGENPSEGGYVYVETGIHKDVVELDIASMHPWSLINMNHFGPYTERFKDLVMTRIHVKRGEFDEAREMFGGQLVPYLKDETTAKQLSYALKLIINIVYGMTSAKFDNKFKHPDNVDNIVAKRGALFMIDLKHAVQDKGYQVVQIKTDSIKIAGADNDIIKFVKDYGEEWGYDFGIDNRFDVVAMVNKAVILGRHEEGGETVWTTIGAQYAEPYVYKRLLSKDDISEEDYALVKQTTKPMYLGETFVGRVANVYASKTGQELKRVDEEQDKESYVSGTKGHLWKLFTDYDGKEDVDISFYEGLVKKAVNALYRVGDASDIIDVPEAYLKE